LALKAVNLALLNFLKIKMAGAVGFEPMVLINRKQDLHRFTSLSHIITKLPASSGVVLFFMTVTLVPTEACKNPLETWITGNILGNKIGNETFFGNKLDNKTRLEPLILLGFNWTVLDIHCYSF
jgi:hypothetical protein